MKHLISAAMSFLLLFRPAVAFGINAEAAAELKSVSAAAVLDRIFVFSENSKIVSVNGKNVIADNYTKFENENIYIDKRVAIGNGMLTYRASIFRMYVIMKAALYCCHVTTVFLKMI